jgi:hypothetical protein
MAEFRREWLPAGWEEEYRRRIYDVQLDTRKENFYTWMTTIRRYNAALRGSTSFLDDKELCHCLESGLDDDLKNRAQLEQANNLTDLAQWTQKIRDIDSHRQSEWKRLVSDIEEHIGRMFKKVYAQHTACASMPAGNAPRPGGNTTTSKSDYPPRLTDNECQLLREHHGCFKCHEFYTEHQLDTCTARLSSTNYKTRMLQDALWAKANKDTKTTRHSATIAAVTEALPDVSDLPDANSLVAALFPDSLPNHLEDDSFDNNVSLVSAVPLKCKHFTWSCQLDNATDSFTINALIDSGAHMVLIHTNTAHRLGLQELPLQNPEFVNVAISNDK